MSFWSKLGNVASIAGPAAATFFTGGAASPLLFSRIASMAGPMGAGLAGMAGSAAKNRGTAAEIAMMEEDRRQGRERLRQGDDITALSAGNLNRQQVADFHNQMLAREQEGRVGRGAAMRDLQTAEYLAGGGAKQGPITTTSGRELNTMGLGGRAATEGEMQGARGMRDEVMKRLEGGSQLPAPTMPGTFQLPGTGQPRLYDQQFGVDPKLMQSGLMERIGNIAGPALGMLGRNQFTKRPYPMDEDLDPNELS